MKEINLHPIQKEIQEWRYQHGYRLLKKRHQERGSAVWDEINQVLFSSPLLMTAYLDKNYSFIRVNSAFASFFAANPDTLLGTGFFYWFSSTDPAILEEIVKSGQPHTMRGQIYNFDGPPPRRLVADVHWIPTVDSLGEPFLIVQILDKTPIQRLQEEKESLQHQRDRLIQMQAFDEFTGNISHYFNNILTIIGSNLEFAGLEASHRVRKHLMAAKEAAQRAAKMVEQLLHYGEKRDVVRHIDDMQSIINDVVRLMRETLDKRIRIELKMQETPARILCDSAQIRSVVLTLLLNARDAIHEILYGSILSERRNEAFLITVEIGIVSMEENRLESADPPNNYLRLRIGDNGAGMECEVQQRIFDPFFTTKAAERDTGLSLSSAYGMIRQHQGWINVKSRAGKGTTVEMYLPMGEDFGNSTKQLS